MAAPHQHDARAMFGKSFGDPQTDAAAGYESCLSLKDPIAEDTGHQLRIFVIGPVPSSTRWKGRPLRTKSIFL
jgi:hypothetical protein